MTGSQELSEVGGALLRIVWLLSYFFNHHSGQKTQFSCVKITLSRYLSSSKCLPPFLSGCYGDLAAGCAAHRGELYVCVTVMWRRQRSLLLPMNTQTFLTSRAVAMTLPGATRQSNAPPSWLRNRPAGIQWGEKQRKPKYQNCNFVINRNRISWLK